MYLEIGIADLSEVFAASTQDDIVRAEAGLVAANYKIGEDARLAYAAWSRSYELIHILKVERFSAITRRRT